MTQSQAIVKQEDLALLRELMAKADPLPWAYRSQEQDDWGMIRTTIESKDGWHPVVAVSRGDTEHGLHRAAGTDPYEPNGALIVAAVNALPLLLAALSTPAETGSLAELRSALTTQVSRADQQAEWAIREAENAVRLEAENARLRSALEPFAKAGDAVILEHRRDERGDHWLFTGKTPLNIGDLRRARTALASIREGDAG